MFKFGLCRAPGIVCNELPSSEQLEEEAVEEEDLLPPTDDLDLDKINEELQSMKMHVTELQNMLSIDAGVCPTTEPCVDLEVELNCSENKEICLLQRNQHKLQQQLCAILKCCHFVKEQVKDLRARHCQERMQLQQLEKMFDKFNSFKLTLEHEFALCRERFEYLKHVKCEWSECQEIIEQLKTDINSAEKYFVPKECYIQDKKYFSNKFFEMRTLCNGLYNLFQRRLKTFQIRLNKQTNMFMVKQNVKQIEQKIKEK